MGATLNTPVTSPRFERFSRIRPIPRVFRVSRGGLRPLGELYSTQSVVHNNPNFSQTLADHLLTESEELFN